MGVMEGIGRYVYLHLISVNGFIGQLITGGYRLVEIDGKPRDLFLLLHLKLRENYGRGVNRWRVNDSTLVEMRNDDIS